MGMRIRIDEDRCTGHGRCYALAPRVFEPDDDGNGRVISADVAPELEDEARSGARNCPEEAITITE
jgi:ferredoxin